MGFSAEWLRLREPADHAARDAALLRQAAQAAGTAPVIVDLGSGTGSTLRAFAGVAPTRAQWHLVDYDTDLLAQAQATGGGQVQTHVIDLTKLDTLPLAAATLVTASALLDLCSADWLEGLAKRIAARQLPFYAALSYDGVMEWSQRDPADQAILAAFNRHQRRDKGFGPALGPDAPNVARRIFRNLGYNVLEADSPWRLDADQAQLHAEFLGGVAQAATEIGGTDAQHWLARRKAQLPTLSCDVGHRDLLALPPGKGAADAQGREK
jgi:hypothetical protein